MYIKTLGIDIAKNVFQVHGIDHVGKKVINKAITKNKLPGFINQLPRCLIGMEACAGLNYWGQKFMAMGQRSKTNQPSVC